MTTTTITRTTVEFYIRKGNVYGNRPAWRLEIDGEFVATHKRKQTLIELAERIAARTEQTVDEIAFDIDEDRFGPQD